MSYALDPDLPARLAPDLRAVVEAQLRQALTAEAELRRHLEAENADLRARNDRLEHLMRELQRARFGPRSEKLHPDQMELAFEDIEVAIATATEEHDAAVQARTGKRPPRQPRGPRTLPKELPREEQVIAPEDLTWSPSDAPLMGWMAPAPGISMCHGGRCRSIRRREPSMGQPAVIGLDLAKSVFQAHGVDADGTTLLRRQLRRSQVLTFFSRLEPCVVGMEACAGAHHWARELSALGHEVRLMPAAYVKPYVKRGKTDRADAEAICEAVARPTMRFVPVKSAEGQAALLDHKARDFLIRQQTQTVNTIRAHLTEFGIVVAKGIHNVDRLLDAAEQAPEAARPALDLLAEQLRELRDRIETVTKRIEAAQEADPLARRLTTIPGLGPIASSAFAATTPDVAAFRSARDCSAWLGLTPKPHSSGGRERLGRISKAGDRYLRRLLYLGAMAQIAARRRGRPGTDWLWKMLERKPVKVVAIALANRMARVVWALIRTGESYRPAAA